MSDTNATRLSPADKAAVVAALRLSAAEMLQRRDDILVSTVLADQLHGRKLYERSLHAQALAERFDAATDAVLTSPKR